MYIYNIVQQQNADDRQSQNQKLSKIRNNNDINPKHIDPQNKKQEMGETLSVIINNPLCDTTQPLVQLLQLQHHHSQKQTTSPNIKPDSGNQDKTMKLISRVAHSLHRGSNNNSTNIQEYKRSENAHPTKSAIKILHHNQQQNTTIFQIKSANSSQHAHYGNRHSADAKTNCISKYDKLGQDKGRCSYIGLSGRTTYSGHKSNNKSKLSITYKNNQSCLRYHPQQQRQDKSSPYSAKLAQSQHCTDIHTWNKYIIKRTILSTHNQTNLTYLLECIQSKFGNLALSLQPLGSVFQNTQHKFNKLINNAYRNSNNKMIVNANSDANPNVRGNICKLVAYQKQYQGFLCGSHSSVNLIFQYLGTYTLQQQINLRASQLITKAQSRPKKNINNSLNKSNSNSDSSADISQFRQYSFKFQEILFVIKFLLDVVEEMDELYGCTADASLYSRINLSHVIIVQPHKQKSADTQTQAQGQRQEQGLQIKQQSVKGKNNKLGLIQILRNTQNPTTKTTSNKPIQTRAQVRPKQQVNIKYLNPIDILYFQKQQTATQLDGRQHTEQLQQEIVSRMISDVGICVLSLCLLQDCFQSCCNSNATVCVSAVENKIEEVAKLYSQPSNNVSTHQNKNTSSGHIQNSPDIVLMLCKLIQTFIFQSQTANTNSQTHQDLHRDGHRLKLKQARSIFNKLYIQHQKMVLNIVPNLPAQSKNRNANVNSSTICHQLLQDTSILIGHRPTISNAHKYNRQSYSRNTQKHGADTYNSNSYFNKKMNENNFDNIANNNQIRNRLCKIASMDDVNNGQNRKHTNTLTSKSLNANIDHSQTNNREIGHSDLHTHILRNNTNVQPQYRHSINKPTNLYTQNSNKPIQTQIDRQICLDENNGMNKKLSNLKSLSKDIYYGTHQIQDKVNKKLNKNSLSMVEPVDWNIQKSSQRKVQIINDLKPKTTQWRLQQINNQFHTFDNNPINKKQVYGHSVTVGVKCQQKNIHTNIQEIDKKWKQNEELFRNMPEFDPISSGIFNLGTSRFMTDRLGLKSKAGSVFAIEQQVHGHQQFKYEPDIHNSNHNNRNYQGSCPNSNNHHNHTHNLSNSKPPKVLTHL